MFSLSLIAKNVGNIGCNHSELSINIQLRGWLKHELMCSVLWIFFKRKKADAK